MEKGIINIQNRKSETFCEASAPANSTTPGSFFCHLEDLAGPYPEARETACSPWWNSAGAHLRIKGPPGMTRWTKVNKYAYRFVCVSACAGKGRERQTREEKGREGRRAENGRDRSRKVAGQGREGKRGSVEEGRQGQKQEWNTQKHERKGKEESIENRITSTWEDNGQQHNSTEKSQKQLWLRHCRCGKWFTMLVCSLWCERCTCDLSMHVKSSAFIAWSNIRNSKANTVQWARIMFKGGVHLFTPFQCRRTENEISIQ